MLVFICEDIIFIVKYLVSLINQKVEIDDIDYLSNCCVCMVGEQFYVQFGVGLACMACIIRECMNVWDNEVFILIDLINVWILFFVINLFFGISQLFQFLD